MSRRSRTLLFFGAFAVGTLILGGLGIAAASQIGGTEVRQRVVNAIVIAVIAVLAVGASQFGLLARAAGRLRALEERFPGSSVLSFKKTPALSYQIVIWNGRTTTSGVQSNSLGYLSSLLITDSGATVWTGASSALRMTLEMPVDCIKEISTEQSSTGTLLRLDIEKGTVPIALLFPVVGLGRVRAIPLDEADVQRIAADIRSKLASR